MISDMHCTQLTCVAYIPEATQKYVNKIQFIKVNSESADIMIEVSKTLLSSPQLIYIRLASQYTDDAYWYIYNNGGSINLCICMSYLKDLRIIVSQRGEDDLLTLGLNTEGSN